MEADSSRVIVTNPGTTGTAQVHHQEFPEIRADGQSSREAAYQLGNQLARALDTALTNWRREAIQRAIADVEAFAKSRT